MRLIVLMLNVSMVGAFVFLTIENGFPSTREEDFWIFVLFSTSPIVTLYYLLVAANKETWLQLFFRRKMAEEKQKLKQLNEQDHS